MAKTQIKGENVFDKSLKAIDIDISGATEKTTLVDNDSIAINDSADNLTKRSKLSTLLAYFTTIFQRKLLLQELSSLTDVIPSGFKGLFAKESGLFWKNSDATIKEVATTEYVQSRGENLITNGTALLRNNTNFTAWIFDGSQAYGSGGAFKFIGAGSPIINELIPVDPSLKYKLNFYARTLLGLGKYYAYVGCFDVDKLAINAFHHMYMAGSTTTLAQQLNNGDTVVYLTSAANWYNIGTAGVSIHLRSFIWWDYANSFGYVYPQETYSRNLHQGMWNPGGVNFVNNTITLIAPWAGGTKTAGTKVSNGSAGAGYKYLGLLYTQVPQVWTNYNGIMDGIDYSGTNAYNKFCPGTAFVNVGFLMDYTPAQNDTLWLANMGFAMDLDTNQTIGYSSNVNPTQTGTTTKALSWVLQYCVQSINWLKSSLLALGELSTNAYRGDRGKIAYDHSQVAHAPSTAEQNVNSDWNAVSGDAQILNKPTIPAAQVQTNWNAVSGMGVLLNKPASLPANGGNADTLDSLHASAFARFNTAFTTWDNIASNTPPVHVHVLDATGVLYNKDLFMYLDVNNSDTAPKVFVLQPGTYSINDIIDCSTHNLVGIIGLSKHDTIIEIECNEALTNLKFLENVTLKITAAFTGTFLVSAADSAGSYVKSVSVACDDIVNDCFDVFAFQGFNSVENIDIKDVTGACNDCKNVSNVRVVNSTVTTATEALSLFYSCVNLSNINITHNDFNTMFSKCDNITNVIINLASYENSQGFNNCTNLSNCNITGAYIAVMGCTVVSNVIIAGATTGIQESTIITNCKTDNCTSYGFSDSEKLTNCLAANTVLTGYDRCRGMLNNKADLNTTNYNSCNADLGGLFTVADTPNGGFNA